MQVDVQLPVWEAMRMSMSGVDRECGLTNATQALDRVDHGWCLPVRRGALNECFVEPRDLAGPASEAGHARRQLTWNDAPGRDVIETVDNARWSAIQQIGINPPKLRSWINA